MLLEIKCSVISKVVLKDMLCLAYISDFSNWICMALQGDGQCCSQISKSYTTTGAGNCRLEIRLMECSKAVCIDRQVLAPKNRELVNIMQIKQVTKK